MTTPENGKPRERSVMGPLIPMSDILRSTSNFRTQPSAEELGALNAWPVSDDLTTTLVSDLMSSVVLHGEILNKAAEAQFRIGDAYTPAAITSIFQTGGEHPNYVIVPKEGYPYAIVDGQVMIRIPHIQTPNKYVLKPAYEIHTKELIRELTQTVQTATHVRVRRAIT